MAPRPRAAPPMEPRDHLQQLPGARVLPLDVHAHTQLRRPVLLERPPQLLGVGASSRGPSVVQHGLTGVVRQEVVVQPVEALQ